MSNWIKLSEKVPELGQLVLCFNNYGDFETCLYDKHWHSRGPFFASCTGEFFPTHWQPLPEPPTE